MPRCSIDHITVTAPTLESGAVFVRDALGVEPRFGGEHPRMGTHNLLVRLGESQYLEVISPNPKAARPDRPRWFGLDDMHPDAVPSLSTWVVRTTDIRETISRCSEPLGTVEPMSRGTLSWLISIPADGRVPVDGVGPALIEWHTDVHPASTLPDVGLSLSRLEIFHADPHKVSRLLSSIELEGRFSVLPLAGTARPHLVAHIETPRGIRILSHPGAAVGGTAQS